MYGCFFILSAQHCALHHPREGYIGTIATALSPLQVVQDAIADASRICEREFGFAPDVVVEGNEHQTIKFVPSHLHHILFELLKNSMRAVIEYHGQSNYDCPPIRLVITDDEKEFAIKISDQGGGIPRNDLKRIWSYLYTTIEAPPTDILATLANTGHINSAPMAGFGYGLPISRLYAQYFGGDLQLVSVSGWGTDAYLYLNKLGDYHLFFGIIVQFDRTCAER